MQTLLISSRRLRFRARSVREKESASPKADSGERSETWKQQTKTAQKTMNKTMKSSRVLGSLILACLALIASQAVATTVHYNDGDLFLGFRSTDGTNDYLVNIGQPDQFVTAP